MEYQKLSPEDFGKYHIFYPYSGAANDAFLTDSDELIAYYSETTECFRLISSSLKFSDINDYLLKYKDETHCIPISPNVADQLLLSYCTTKLLGSNGQEEKLPASSYIIGLVDEQHELSKKRRKVKHFLDMYGRKNRNSNNGSPSYDWEHFAENAKLALLCRSLHFSKDNYSMMFHLYNQGIYFQPPHGDLNGTEKYPKVILSPEPQVPFTLEDYFLYEYYNGGSLAVELTACLLQIKDESTADCILEELKRKLPSFLYSPMIYSRIAVARLYVTEAYGEIKYHEKYYEINSDEAKGRCIRTAFDRVDNAVKGLLYLPDCYTEESYYSIQYKKESLPTVDSDTNDLSSDRQPHCPSTPGPSQRKIRIRKGVNVVNTFEYPTPDQVTHRKIVYKQFVPVPIFFCGSSDLSIFFQRLEQNLSHICDPINIMKYLRTPLYGPVAFCNQEHPKVTTLLNEIRIGRDNYTAERTTPKGRPERTIRKVQTLIWENDLLEKNTELWTDPEKYITDLENFLSGK